MASSLLDLFGGADGFGSATSAYFQNFYSADEQRAALERQLNAALAKVNLKLPDINQDAAREQYRKLAEAQDLTTESGRKAWATLMQLSGSFAQLTQVAGQAMDGLVSERRKLEAELLKARGDTAGYAAAMRAIATDGYSAAEVAAWDYNEALRAQITEAERAATATQDAAAALADLRKQAAGIVQSQQHSLDSLIAGLQRKAEQANGGYVGSSWGRWSQVCLTSCTTAWPFERLRDSMRSFADALLIGDKTTLSPEATLAEMQRQYAEAYQLAAGGDTEAISKYQSLANGLLDKSLYSTKAEYNVAFGRTYGDARALESQGVNVLAQQQNGVVTELKALNASLTRRVGDLERILAQIAKNTAETSRGVEGIALGT